MYEYLHFSHEGPNTLTTTLRRYCMDPECDSGLILQTEYVYISIAHEVDAQCVVPHGYCAQRGITCTCEVPDTRFEYR